MSLKHVHVVRTDGPGDVADAGPDRVLGGSGAARLWNAFSDPAGRFHVGHWQAEPGTLSIAYTEDELCVILEGRVRLTGPDGVIEFGPGDAFVIAAGFAGTWESLGRVTKIYAILDPA